MNINEYIQGLKNRITQDDICRILDDLEVPYHNGNGFIRAKTCCHNLDLNGAGYNLSIKDNYCTCFSCCGNFDIIELLRKTRRIRGEDSRLVPTLKYLCRMLGVEFNMDEGESNIYSWNYLMKYKSKNNRVDLKIYDEGVLDGFEPIIYEPWLDEHISEETQAKFNIRWYNRTSQIVIPIYNLDGLVGIRVRNLVPEKIDEFGKYRPLELLDGSMFNFPSGEVLFNYDNLYDTNEAIIVESEKACLQLDSYGYKGVGLFGKNFSDSQLKLLLKSGISDVTIALDSDVSDEDIMKIANKCKPFLNVYIVGRLEGKLSPSDLGKDVWEKLYRERKKYDNL